jgi:hypothetical protein
LPWSSCRTWPSVPSIGATMRADRNGNSGRGSKLVAASRPGDPESSFGSRRYSRTGRYVHEFGDAITHRNEAAHARLLHAEVRTHVPTSVATVAGTLPLLDSDDYLRLRLVFAIANQSEGVRVFEHHT